MNNGTPVFFKSFSSGSCGNCYLLLCGGQGVLIDAGVSMRRLKAELQRCGLCFDDIKAVLVTHDHMDHIRNLGSYCKRMRKSVWMTPALSASMATHWMTGEYLSPVLHRLSDGWNEVAPGIRALPFVVPHDATQTVGYCLDLQGYRFVIMTDIGQMTDEALSLAREASTVVIESNYDLDMLRSGPYPKILQDRICGGCGHLSNAECSDAVADFMHPGLDNVFLCHLSEHNNTPQKAVETVGRALEGHKVRLMALPRESASPFLEL
ncbi:MAG: MBL fold metallo-hydrolase [Bacteroidales bacterium]|nr:MBL fold metallo-hydrolase [Bacteroidales bacterium]